jgi:glycosyltransferase involved in cell wall biosynthesis
MNQISVSVIVVSRGRPDLLLRCLTGISQLRCRNFEVVVVADQAGISAVSNSPFRDKIKTSQFNEPNISMARNVGLSLASGDVVAFIDDDAVPEPSWLCYLIHPFYDDKIDAAGGFVRGRNGISFQSRATQIDMLGYETPIDVAQHKTSHYRASRGLAIKTPGTNAAFRLSTLRHIGGFDPAFAFYLDETDVNMRLAAQNRWSAIVPLAQVHHGFCSSDRRRNDRMPLSLFDVGASTVVFLRKHAGASKHKTRIEDLYNEQKARLLRHMQVGKCEPRDVALLLETLENGVEHGWRKELTLQTPLSMPKAEFQIFDAERPFSGHKLILSTRSSLKQNKEIAAQHAAKGHVVSIFRFNRSTQFHRAWFDARGFWVQHGGIYGKSERAGKNFRWTTAARRAEIELQRIQRIRCPQTRVDVQLGDVENVP